MRIVIGLALVLLLVGCSQNGPTTQTSSAINVATSISPLADLIKNVGGDKVSVTTLIKPGADPHDFEVKPDTIKAVSSAKLFFANGSGEEPYLAKLANSSPSLEVVTLSQGLDILGKGQGGAYSDTGNPHLWLDPLNAKAYIIKIRDSLSQLSPQDKDYFFANATAYSAQLDLLDQKIRSQISTIPEGNRIMVVFHDAWPYFAKRYSLEHRALVSSSQGEPSAKEYAELIKFIKERQVKTVFGEAGFNPKLIKQLASETGAQFVDNLYDDTVSENIGAETYLKMMSLNTNTIVNSLK